MEIEKQCFKCGEVRSLSAFYKHPQMPDGHVNKCKKCNKRDVRENRAAKIEQYRAYDSARSNKPCRVKARHDYLQTEAGIKSANKAKAKWSDSNKKKVWVANCVSNAIRDGNLSKPANCSSCGKGECRIEGHHKDYDRPLTVTWLCSMCHRQWHKANGEGANPF
jgi:hypothetical protein